MFKNLFKKRSKRVSEETYYSSSEYVSAGHPDRLADILAAIVIDDVQKRDGVNSHAAVEVFLTHDTVYFGGEVTTSLKIDKEYLAGVVREGFEMAGYIPEMRQYWTKKEVMLAEDMKIVNKICAQSPDIALGTTNKGAESGWNDQGVYFSSCDCTTERGIGYPHYVAKLISDALFKESRESIMNGAEAMLGPDNKVVVTVKTSSDGMTPICVTAITIAVAHTSTVKDFYLEAHIKLSVLKWLRNAGITVANGCMWVINGTGRFVVHGCVSDTSMTGRKISVNHPSAGPVWCNKMIGGGTMVKPAHASDLMLNLMSRYIAEVIVAANLSSYAVVGCSCAIGQQGLQSLFIKGDERFEARKDKGLIYDFFFQFVKWSPIAIAEKFGFFNGDFDFARAVKDNFFGDGNSQPWENPDLFLDDAEALLLYISKRGGLRIGAIRSV